MLSALRGLFGLGRQPAEAPPSAPRVPEGACVYAVGDVHGELGRLRRLLAAIEADADALGLAPLVVFLGDYIDRGPESRGVLEFLAGLADAPDGRRYRFLRGNHEETMLGFLRDPAEAAEWLAFGGVDTLASYGVRASAGGTDPARLRGLRDRLEERLPRRHLTFLESLETMVEVGDYVFVHAGVRPGVPLDRQRQEDLLWIREPFLSSRNYHGKVVVHGHTIVEQPLFMPNRIAADTGAYATGRLTAIALHGSHQRVLQCGD